MENTLVYNLPAMRIAKVLDLLLAYFYAEEDELAALIIEFHQQ